MSSRRHSYDTSVKHLFRLGLDEAINQDLKASIPRSNISRWRNEPNDKYVGFELNSISTDQLDQLKAFARDERAQRVFAAYDGLRTTLSSILHGAKQYHRTLREQKVRIVHAIEQAGGIIGVAKAVEYFKLSRSTYQSWLQEVKFKCDYSALLLCRKRYPFQLLPKEVETIRQMLTNPDLLHWPIRSVAAHARRVGALLASDNSWYKYRHVLGVRRYFRRPKRKNKVGIRATAPDQIWHADVMVYRTLDGVKHYIYLVVDNYSRRILAKRRSRVLSGSIRMQTLQEAWEFAVQIRPQLKVDLVVDGGSENVNKVVDGFIGSEGINIHRKVALKDILFSNSLVEATNKTIKYHYLFPNHAQNGAELDAHLDFAEHDLNSVRPHGSLDGHTPDEYYLELPRMDLSEVMKKARTVRKAANQKQHCGKCF